MEAWTQLLPDWINSNILDQLILPKLQVCEMEFLFFYGQFYLRNFFLLYFEIFIVWAWYWHPEPEETLPIIIKYLVFYSFSSSFSTSQQHCFQYFFSKGLSLRNVSNLIPQSIFFSWLMPLQSTSRTFLFRFGRNMLPLYFRRHTKIRLQKEPAYKTVQLKRTPPSEFGGISVVYFKIFADVSTRFNWFKRFKRDKGRSPLTSSVRRTFLALL